MAEMPGSGSSLPAKIMAGLVVCTLLGVGMCAVGAGSGGGKLQYALVAGAVCFWGGLVLMILFGVGWAIFAIGQKLFGSKE